MRTKYQGAQTLEVLEQAKNYNKWIASAINKYIKHPALEVGAGVGNISSFMVSTSEITLSEIDLGLLNILKKKFKANKKVKVLHLDVEKSILSNRKFMTIYSVNVLEHIKDDGKALKNMHRMLLPRGKVILLIPANQFAYTKLDRELGHYRRYTKKIIGEKLEKAGFEVSEIRHFNLLGLLSWIARDKIDKSHSNLATSQVKMFDIFVPLLQILESVIKVPLGISIIAVGVKTK